MFIQDLDFNVIIIVRDYVLWSFLRKIENKNFIDICILLYNIGKK